MTDSKDQLGLLFLPRELRELIWALVAKGGTGREDGEITRGIINCCNQTAQEMIPYLVPFDDEGGLDTVAIGIDRNLFDNVWLTVSFSIGCNSDGAFYYDPYYYDPYHDCEGPSLCIESMDNPILHAMREAKNIKQLAVVLGETPSTNGPLPSAGTFAMFSCSQMGSDFFIHFAKAMDAARLIGSLGDVDRLVIMAGNRDGDTCRYYGSMPLAFYDSACRRRSPRPLDAASPERGPPTPPAESFAVDIRPLSTVTASELLIGAFILEGNRPRAVSANVDQVGSIAIAQLEMTSEMDASRAKMNGYINGRYALLNGSYEASKARYLDLRKLEQLHVKSEGRYMNLHRLQHTSSTWADKVSPSLEFEVADQLIDYKHVLDVYASAIGMAESAGDPTPDMLPLLRHRDATKDTSENNFFYRLSRRDTEGSPASGVKSA